MKKNFVKPSCEVVRFYNSVIATSVCGCYYPEVDEDFGNDSTCVGANISCSCNPNYDDPNANCV